MPSVVCIFCTLGVYLVTGGDWEKRGVIRIDYGVWGERVPSEPNGGSGSGGVTPSQILYKSYQLRHNLVIG